MAYDHKEKGSVGFYVSHSHKDWATNEKRYAFGAVRYGTVNVRVTKNPDRTLSVIVTGAFGSTYELRAPVVLLDNGLGTHIGVTWQENEVSLYMNGVPVTSRAAPKAASAGGLMEGLGTLIGGRRSTRYSTP